MHLNLIIKFEFSDVCTSNSIMATINREEFNKCYDFVVNMYSDSG